MLVAFNYQTGGIIQTNDSTKVGSYICTLTVTSKPIHLAVDSSFKFDLVIVPTVSDPPTSLTEIIESKKYT
jgi:hypothetical protein